MSSISIRPYLTLRIGGSVKELVSLATLSSVEQVARNKNLFILGSGSNTIFSDREHDLMVGKMEITGITVLHENRDTVTLEVGAGTLWDHLVSYAVTQNYQGIEALSAIPGTVGATPIQNVGAYGSEIKDVLHSIHVYDRDDNVFRDIQKTDCSFSYRDSLFKHMPHKFIITHIRLILRKLKAQEIPPIPSYKGISEKLNELSITHPTLSDIRKAITVIRETKLPDPNIIPNCGSFFKNPRFAPPEGQKFIKKFPSVPFFIEPDGLYKIPAGWILEQAGFKGYSGRVGIHEHNALVVVNRGGGNWKDLTILISHIQNTVKEKFSIALEIEPNIIT